MPKGSESLPTAHPPFSRIIPPKPTPAPPPAFPDPAHSRATYSATASACNARCREIRSLNQKPRRNRRTQHQHPPAIVLPIAKNHLIAPHQLLKPIQPARRPRHHRLMIQIALKIIRKTIRRLIPKHPILLHRLNHNPIQIALKQRPQTRRRQMSRLRYHHQLFRRKLSQPLRRPQRLAAHESYAASPPAPSESILSGQTAFSPVNSS